MIYIARDKDGMLNAFKDKPIREGFRWHWDYDINKSCCWRPLNENGFPELKWEDEPKEVDELYFGIYLW